MKSLKSLQLIAALLGALASPAFAHDDGEPREESRSHVTWECDASIPQGDFRFGVTTKGWTSLQAARNEVIRACINAHFDPAVCEWGAYSTNTYCEQR